MLQGKENTHKTKNKNVTVTEKATEKIQRKGIQRSKIFIYRSDTVWEKYLGGTGMKKRVLQHRRYWDKEVGQWRRDTKKKNKEIEKKW